jgi:carboxypeptidase family protein
MTRRILYPAAYLAVAAAAMSIQVVGARQNAVQIDPDDIGGVVTSSKGPEAGVWVIAETKDLPTGFSRTVVTDDRGRYVIPDLPKANYQVFVRGYGLTDSERVQGAPGKILNLTAKIAPSPKDAAQYYPANYWFAMLNIPAKSEFPIQEQ